MTQRSRGFQMRMRSVFGALGVASLFMATGAMAAPPDGERAYRYELRALGTYAGEAIFTIGAEEEVGKRTLRPVRIDAHTSGLAANFLDAKTRSTAWVSQTWLPMRVRWDQTIDGVERVVKASFDRKGVKATDEKKGKVDKYDLKTPSHGHDLVSIFAWLMQADLSPGSTYELPVFDGKRIYNVKVTAGVAKEIQVPVGFRQAIPLKIHISRGEYKRDMELWLSAEKDRVPLKLIFKYGLIGTVEASLVGERKSSWPPGDRDSTSSPDRPQGSDRILAMSLRVTWFQKRTVTLARSP